jgi:hypothetical protein
LRAGGKKSSPPKKTLLFDSILPQVPPIFTLPIGDYHYRHPEYEAYRQSVNEAYPGLPGGLRRNALENRLHPLEIALLSASIPPELFADVLGRDHSKPLFRRWRESALVEEDSRSGCLRLTANGSWFTSQMMAELSAP